jgi:TolB-like protein
LSLWSEIRQRRITQIVVTYLAGGWIVTSVVDQVVDREVLPLVVYQVTFTLFLFGILGALIIGWYHGEKGAQEAPPIEIAMLVVVGVLAVGASGRIVMSSMNEARVQDSLAEAGLDLRRIGVLYFEDLSPDGSAQAVADAITEGLISNLSTVRDLEITSRNGARAVRDLDIDEVGADSIARILDVGTLVTGTVEPVGDEIRVTVRLIEGRDAIQIHRDSYRWPASEVASVSSELAAEVGNALREELGVEVRMRESQAAAPNDVAWLEVARAERSLKAANEALAAGDGGAYFDALDAADAALVRAQEAAPEWAEPVVLRAQVAYEPWRYMGSTDEQLEVLDRAIELANEALALEPDSPGALEWRGTARYARWLLEVDDEDEMDRLIASAQADLERAVTLDEDRASVKNTLSHLYFNVGDPFEGVMKAREAYTQDAFLAVADAILWRLFEAQYDANDYDEAEEWCQEGRRRFPDNFRFVQCQIYAMTMRQAEPDVAEAWRLYDEMTSMMPPGDQSELVQGITRTFIGGVIGRAGLADSADVVMTRARLSEEIDPVEEQMSMEAAMRSVIGDVDGSIERLQRYMVANPGHFPGDHWWWDSAARDPRFDRLRDAR